MAEQKKYLDNAGVKYLADKLTKKSDFDSLKTEVNSKLGDAPSDSKSYARKNGAWAEVKSGVGKAIPNGGEIFNDYENNQATGLYSHAEGYAMAFGDYSHAEGGGSYAKGECSHAEGMNTQAIESNSHAEGRGTIASSSASHAEGSYTKTTGYGSHAEGDTTVASGDASHAEGKNTTAFGECSHAEGYSNVKATEILNLSSVTNETIFNTWKLKEGNFNLAKGLASYAGGYNCIAIDDFSHATGHKTAATEMFSHAEGSYTKATGVSSHAEGSSTIASGISSHAEGSDTKATGYGSHAEGQYNVDNSSWIHMVGIGKFGLFKNAHVITNEGKHYIPGIGEYKGTETEIPSDGSIKDLATVVNENKSRALTNDEIAAILGLPVTA